MLLLRRREGSTGAGRSSAAAALVEATAPLHGGRCMALARREMRRRETRRRCPFSKKKSGRLRWPSTSLVSKKQSEHFKTNSADSTSFLEAASLLFSHTHTKPQAATDKLRIGEKQSEKARLGAFFSFFKDFFQVLSLDVDTRQPSSFFLLPLNRDEENNK